jgi:hypothetical protein
MLLQYGHVSRHVYVQSNAKGHSFPCCPTGELVVCRALRACGLARAPVLVPSISGEGWYGFALVVICDQRYKSLGRIFC